MPKKQTIRDFFVLFIPYFKIKWNEQIDGDVFTQGNVKHDQVRKWETVCIVNINHNFTQH